MTERWVKVAGHEDYIVSDLGRVRRAKVGARILAPVRSGLRGDHSVKLHGKRCLVSRLVCEAFIGPPFPGAEAAHCDGDFTNNRADNLRWATSAENNADKIQHGTHQAGEQHPRSKLTAADVASIIASPLSRKEAAAQFGVSPFTIAKIRQGQRWKGAGTVREADAPIPRHAP